MQKKYETNRITRELVTIAVMSALAVASRVAFLAVPHFKPTVGIIMITGMAFGVKAGFITGAMSAFVSNFFFGQGAYTPWQMVAYGSAGLAGGLFFQRGWLKRKRLPMAVFGAVCVQVLVGLLLDTCTVFLTLTEITPKTAWPIYLSGLPVNASQALCTFLTILLLGEPLLEKLDRVKLKFGLAEE